MIIVLMAEFSNFIVQLKIKELFSINNFVIISYYMTLDKSNINIMIISSASQYIVTIIYLYL